MSPIHPAPLSNVETIKATKQSPFEAAEENRYELDFARCPLSGPGAWLFRHLADRAQSESGKQAARNMQELVGVLSEGKAMPFWTTVGRKRRLPSSLDSLDLRGGTPK
jgi:hypothetical protein